MLSENTCINLHWMINFLLSSMAYKEAWQQKNVTCVVRFLSIVISFWVGLECFKLTAIFIHLSGGDYKLERE